MKLSTKIPMKCSAISMHFPIQITPHLTYTVFLLKNEPKCFPCFRLKEHYSIFPKSFSL